MTKFSSDVLKTIIEINSDINSDYSDKTVLLFRILKWAVHLTGCERAAFLMLDKDSGKLQVLSATDGAELDIQRRILPDKTIASIVMNKRQTILVNEIPDDPYYSNLVKGNAGFSFYSIISAPVQKGCGFIGIIEAINKRDGGRFDETDFLLVEFLAGSAASALDAADTILMQKNEIAGLKQNLRQAFSSPTKIHDFIFASPVMQDLMIIVKKAAITNSSVLITGESGVGKELFAEQIYLNSARRDKPFVRVNCAALSATLMESELFGHVKGAYTSADTAREGRFKLADGGTIFLDEVGEIPLAVQPKLLRIIQDKQFEMVGSSVTLSVDVRIIAATNRNLEEMVRQGLFREDLYFRLNVLPIRVPPLRARKEDILPIAEHFLLRYAAEVGKTYEGFSESALKAMTAYRWPGNIRELENAVARACIIGNPPMIQTADMRLMLSAEDKPLAFDGQCNELAAVVADSMQDDRTLKSALRTFKRAYLIKILEECSWNQTKAGAVLGIQRTYVSSLMRELHVRDKLN